MDRLLTRHEVEHRIGIKRSALYRMMRAGIFPLPKKIGPRAVRWSLEEIESWLEAQPRSNGHGIRRAAQA